MIFLAIYLACVVLFCSAWYWLSRRHIRRRAACVVRWIEAALEGQGRVMGMRWVGAARFKVPLRLASSVFRRTWMLVDLCPCEMPTQWLWNKITRREEQVTFQADLDWAPPFSLDVHNFRWFARSSRKSSTTPVGWTLEQTGPFIITTRMQWPKEITSTMTSLVETRNREFHHISFSRISPHFSVTMPLEAISPTCPSRTCVFDAVREVAASSLPSLF